MNQQQTLPIDSLLVDLKYADELSQEQRDLAAKVIENSVPADQHQNIVNLKNQEIGEMYTEIRVLREQRQQLADTLVTRNNQVEQLNNELTMLREKLKGDDG